MVEGWARVQQLTTFGLRLQFVELPDDIVSESIPFRLLQSHVQTMAGEVDTKSKELEKVQKEADGLRENQETFRQMTSVRLALFAQHLEADSARCPVDSAKQTSRSRRYKSACF